MGIEPRNVRVLGGNTLLSGLNYKSHRPMAQTTMCSLLSKSIWYTEEKGEKDLNFEQKLHSEGKVT